MSRIPQLHRPTGHTPTWLPDDVVSYDESPFIQLPLIQDQLAAVQVQLEVLAIDAAQEQDAEENHDVQAENMQVDRVEYFEFEEETQQ
ncbi:hypothetical protein EC957_011926 [Mortierella hygrophila]|uniref:Uncharacterized protein n=1 Tax=Mortierella hygrophila TaxID=979708 RepID=A0A9P6K3U7_9FUNG|nr:hypothetical protein EC957_011926 [Mortierella hygrophila]